MKARRIFLVATVTMIVAVANRAVANAPAGRYTITNGTVLDNKTHLTWQQTVGTNMTMATAKATCASAGFRIPTLKEMATIIDYQQPISSTNPLIDQTAFPGTPNAFFWTVTPTGAFFWTVTFFPLGIGFANLSLADPTTPSAVRCVR